MAQSNLNNNKQMYIVPRKVKNACMHQTKWNSACTFCVWVFMLTFAWEERKKKRERDERKVIIQIEDASTMPVDFQVDSSKTIRYNKNNKYSNCIWSEWIFYIQYQMMYKILCFREYLFCNLLSLWLFSRYSFTKFFYFSCLFILSNVRVNFSFFSCRPVFSVNFLFDEVVSFFFFSTIKVQALELNSHSFL